MYPAQNHQLLFVAVVKQFLLVERLARVACAGLLGNKESCDEECIGFEDAAQYATGFEVETRVRRGGGKELLA